METCKFVTLRLINVHVLRKSTHCSIILFHGQPAVTDEEIFSLGLEVSDLHSAEEPARTVSSVIMPDSTGLLYTVISHIEFTRTQTVM